MNLILRKVNSKNLIFFKILNIDNSETFTLGFFISQIYFLLKGNTNQSFRQNK